MTNSLTAKDTEDAKEKGKLHRQGRKGREVSNNKIKNKGAKATPRVACGNAGWLDNLPGWWLQPVYDALYAVAHMDSVEIEQESHAIVASAKITQQLRGVDRQQLLD